MVWSSKTLANFIWKIFCDVFHLSLAKLSRFFYWENQKNVMQRTSSKIFLLFQTHCDSTLVIIRQHCIYKSIILHVTYTVSSSWLDIAVCLSRIESVRKLGRTCRVGRHGSSVPVLVSSLFSRRFTVWAVSNLSINIAESVRNGLGRCDGELLCLMQPEFVDQSRPLVMGHMIQCY